MSYANVVWANCDEESVYRVLRLQKRAARVINRAAVGGRGSRTAFGFLTALPKAGAVLELPSVF